MKTDDVKIVFEHTYNNNIVCKVFIRDAEYRIDPDDIKSLILHSIGTFGYSFKPHIWRQRYKRLKLM